MGIEITAAAAAMYALTAVSTAAAVYGAVDQADSARREGHTQADQAQANARAEQGAANVQAEQIRRAGLRQRAAAVAQLAGSGVDVNEGSAIDVTNRITQNSEYDAVMSTLDGTARLRAGYGEAGSLRTSGDNRARAGYISAGTTALEGATSAYRAGYKPAPATTPAGTK